MFYTDCETWNSLVSTTILLSMPLSTLLLLFIVGPRYFNYFLIILGLSSFWIRSSAYRNSCGVIYLRSLVSTCMPFVSCSALLSMLSMTIIKSLWHRIPLCLLSLYIKRTSLCYWSCHINFWSSCIDHSDLFYSVKKIRSW